MLSNLYLHVVFDGWIGKQVRAKFAFERYADDIIIHTSSEVAAKFMLKRMTERFTQCGLELHPQKTKLVQTESYRAGIQDKTYAQSFEFLGHQSRTYGMPGESKGQHEAVIYLTYQPKIKAEDVAGIKVC